MLAWKLDGFLIGLKKKKRKNKFAVIHEFIYYFCDIDWKFVYKLWT